MGSNREGKLPTFFRHRGHSFNPFRVHSLQRHICLNKKSSHIFWGRYIYPQGTRQNRFSSVKQTTHASTNKRVHLLQGKVECTLSASMDDFLRTSGISLSTSRTKNNDYRCDFRFFFTILQFSSQLPQFLPDFWTYFHRRSTP